MALMQFHSLTLANLPAIMNLEHSIKPSASWFPVDADYQKRIIMRGLNFGVFDNGTLIGKVGFTSEKEDEFEVDGMIMKDKYRNQGIGQKLFSYALNELMNKTHPKKVTLFTHPDNSAAIALYQKFNFVTKELIPNKYGEGMHRIRMEKIIRYV